MEITKVTINPNGNAAIEPEMHIQLQYTWSNTPIVAIQHRGYLFLDNTHRLSILNEYDFENNAREEHLRSLRGTVQKGTAHKTFVAPLGRRALELMIDSRLKNKKKDLELELKFSIDVLEPDFQAAINVVLDRERKNVPTLENDALFKRKTYALNHKFTIKSSDWINDYCPVFNLGRYKVFEIPLIDKFEGEHEIIKHLRAAVESLDFIEDAMNNGDWNSVIKESRPVWELFRDREQFTKLLKANDLNQITSQSFNSLMESCFDFASKFIHRKARGSKEVSAINNASKEEAQFIYSMAFSIVNLIGKKIIYNSSGID